MTTVEDICNQLLANSGDLKKLEWTNAAEFSDPEKVAQLCAALQQNDTVEAIHFEEVQLLSAPTCLEISSVLAEHPSVEQLNFYNTEIEDFDAFARAFAENEKLSSLRFHFCQLRSSTIQGIKFLLESNSLESFWLTDCQGAGPNLCESLEKNTSLTYFHVSGSLVDDPSFSNQSASALPKMLAVNRRLMNVETRVKWVPETANELVLSALESARGHPSLRSLEIGLYKDRQGEEHVSQRHANRVVTELAGMLRDCPCLEYLYIESCLPLDGVEVSFEDVANALKENTTLWSLDLPLVTSNNSIVIAEALPSNNRLSHLSVGVNEQSALPLLQSLPQMNLEYLTLRFVDCETLSSRLENAIVSALEQNTILKKFGIQGVSGGISDKLKAKMKHFASLNRLGRKHIIGSQNGPIPRRLWSQILARSSTEPSILYYFVREKLDELVLQNREPCQSRKRKRDE